MTLQARLTCSEGTALRFPGAIPMADGDSVVVDVQSPATHMAPDVEAIMTDAANAHP